MIATLFLFIRIALAGPILYNDTHGLNEYQKEFVERLIYRKVNDGNYRFHTFQYRSYWTYSNTTSFPAANDVLQESKDIEIFTVDEAYSQNSIVAFPNLSDITVEQWHQLLESDSIDLLVGDISQSVLENCSTFSNLPKRIFVSGEKKYSAKLMSCFPNTDIYFNRTKSFDSTLETALKTGKGFPNRLILSEGFDIASVNLLRNYTGDVVILGHKLPGWFKDAYKGNKWKTLSLPEIDELVPDVATILASEGRGRIRLDNLKSLTEESSEQLIGHSEHHFDRLDFPRLSELSPKSISHITKHIPVVTVGTVPWTLKNIKAVQGSGGHFNHINKYPNHKNC